MDPRFPILEVCDGLVCVHADEPALRGYLERATDDAIKDGYFDRVRYFDAQLAEFRVAKFRLEGHVGFFGWLRDRRTIAELEITLVRDVVPLPEVVDQVTQAIESAADEWSGGHDVDELLRAVAGAASFEELVRVLGGGPR